MVCERLRVVCGHFTHVPYYQRGIFQKCRQWHFFQIIFAAFSIWTFYVGGRNAL